jgi:hypothetical protein
MSTSTRSSVPHCARRGYWVWPFALCVHATIASAQTRSSAAGIGEHDGFYFRFGSAIGYTAFDGDIQGDADPTPPPIGAADASLAGPSFGADLLVGGTPAPGLVVGGAFIYAFLPASWQTVSVAGSEMEPQNDAFLLLLAAFGQFYPDPKTGFHLHALLGLASGQPDIWRVFADDPALVQCSGDAVKCDGPNQGDLVGVGAGFGAGYDAWIGEQWSVGPVMRIVVATLAETSGSWDESYHVVQGQLVIGATLH